MDPSPHRGAPSHPLPADDESTSSDQNHHRVRFAEGGPQASYMIYQPRPRREGSTAATASSAALPTRKPPSVYWAGDDDRDNDRETITSLAGYTFYREGTPPPPEYPSPEKRWDYGEGHSVAGPPGSSTAGGGTIASDRGFNLGHLSQGDTNWSLADSRNASPIAKRRVLWAIIAVGVLIVIGVAVGVGVGLGVGRSKGQGAAADSAGPSSSSPASVSGPSPAPTSPPSTTPSNTDGDPGTTTGSAASPRPTYNSDCPSLNNTVYHVPGSTRSFLRVCGVDYSGSGATDLAYAYTESMADCMNSCASFDQCEACAWGYIEGDEGSKHRCYMKKNLVQSHVAARDWCFAILQ